MIGASGAISAVLGAYLVLFPRARIQSLVFLGFFYQLIAVPAVHRARVLVRAPGRRRARLARAHDGVDGGVAFFAHIGGFVAGTLMALPFRLRRQPHGPALAPAAWDNRRMADDRGTEIEMIVESVRVHMPTGRHVLLLKEVGASAPAHLDRALGGQRHRDAAPGRLTPERPLTHDLFVAVLDDARRAHRADRHLDLADETFHARLELVGADAATRSTPARRTRSRWRSGSACPIFAVGGRAGPGRGAPDDGRRRRRRGGGRGGRRDRDAGVASRPTRRRPARRSTRRASTSSASS